VRWEDGKMQCEVEGARMDGEEGLTETNVTEDMIWMIMKHEA